MIDQDRDHGEIPIQRRFQLDPNKVSRVVEPSVSVGFPSPFCSDHGEDHVALPDSRIDVFPEVFTKRYGIDVHEDGIVAEVSTKAVVDPPGNADRILTPIREKDPRHRAVAMSVLL